jgi:hypothetical protein
MKAACACILLVGASTLASARPIVIEESATLTNPDPVLYAQFGRMVATNGEYALVLGSRDDIDNPGGEDDLQRRDALLYRRIAGQWQYQGILRGSLRPWEGYNFPDLLRLEVVGNQLRGYVNGNLMLQATDSSHTAGISGLMTNKSATRFDDYVAYQP